MKTYHSFGKSATTALLVTMLVGAILGCRDDPSDPILQSIAITRLPTRVEYTVGEALTLSGIEVTGTYSDGTTRLETVTLANVSGYDANITGIQTLTVTVGGKTAPFTVITVNEVSTSPIGLDELASAEGGDNVVDPVSVALSGNLNDIWESALSTIADVGKYVSLDLFACTMDGTEFDPGTTTDGADKITALVLPKTAKHIKAGTSSNFTFSAFTSLVAISGASVETIGDYAFRGCTDLVTVKLPTATYIGGYAFYDCTNLTAVNLPAAKTIGERAFYYGSRIKAVNLPAATTIGASAFYNCTSLESVSRPAVTTIGSSAFYNCTSLTSVNLPVVTTIGTSIFQYCPKLTTITVDPANTTFTAHDGMLLNKAGTTLIAYPSATGAITLPSVTEIHPYAFYNCTNLTSVSLPAVTTIGTYAFYFCTNLTSVSLPAVTTIGTYAFYYCTKLPSVSLPVATTIGSSAFYNCTNLTSVSLPVATTIGSSAFYYCTNLTSVSLPATPPSLGTAIFYSTGADGTITVSVPVGAVAAYTSAWSVSANTSAGGNTDVYGNNHKAVLITDAAQ
jgi:hypothetical protein